MAWRRKRAYFGNARATEIDTAGIKKYIDARLGEGVMNAMVNRELAALKRMFTLAIIAGKLDRLPHIPKLKGDLQVNEQVAKDSLNHRSALRMFGKVGVLVCALDFKWV